MWLSAIILLLWTADKHLLSKIWALIASTGRKSAWYALGVYSNWNNEMIRDGCHVDEVFLVESENDKEFRELDVLRFFRQQIVKQTITGKKTMALNDFITVCCDPNSNFTKLDPNSKYELVVKYTFDHRQYIIVYDSCDTSSIRFPVYSEREIRERDIKQTGVLSAAQLSASKDADDGIDIYSELKMLAGPLENFYADTEFEIKRHHLNYAGLRFPVDGMYIQMLDGWANSYVIEPEKKVIHFEK